MFSGEKREDFLSRFHVAKIGAYEKWRAPSATSVPENSLKRTGWNNWDLVQDATAIKAPAPSLCRQANSSRWVLFSILALNIGHGSTARQLLSCRTRRSQFATTLKKASMFLLDNISLRCNFYRDRVFFSALKRLMCHFALSFQDGKKNLLSPSTRKAQRSAIQIERRKFMPSMKQISVSASPGLLQISHAVLSRRKKRANSESMKTRQFHGSSQTWLWDRLSMYRNCRLSQMQSHFAMHTRNTQILRPSGGRNRSVALFLDRDSSLIWLATTTSAMLGRIVYFDPAGESSTVVPFFPAALPPYWKNFWRIIQGRTFPPSTFRMRRLYFLGTLLVVLQYPSGM